MSDIRLTKNLIDFSIIIALISLIIGCSMGTHVKNIVNAPIELSSIQLLDSLKVAPDVAHYAGKGETLYHIFKQDIRLKGNYEKRPIWRGTDSGVFKVRPNVTVHILDYNFTDSGDCDTLIHLQGGKLILENCDIFELPGSAIVMDPGSSLELRNVRFANLKGVGVAGSGSNIRIKDSEFDLCGPGGIVINSAKLFEAHNLQISATMGPGIKLTNCDEIWLDSVRVSDSFEDGIVINESDYVLIQNTQSNENGKSGLSLSNSVLSGLIGYTAVGNLVNGLEANSIDSLQISRAELIANGDQGAVITEVLQSRFVNMVVGHNGIGGMAINSSGSIDLQHSTFQANLKGALRVQSVPQIVISTTSFTNNGNGLNIHSGNSIKIGQSIFKANAGTALKGLDGGLLQLSSNSFIENDVGLRLQEFVEARIDSNRFVRNKQGSDLRSIEKVKSVGNLWEQNQFGTFLSEIELCESSGDIWTKQSELGLEAILVSDLLVQKANFNENKQGMFLNEGSIRFEDCDVRQSKGIGVKALNSSLFIKGSQLEGNLTALELGEGSRCNITQTKFSSNFLSILNGPSSELNLSYSSIIGGQNGIVLEDFSEAQIVSNKVNNQQGYFIKIEGPNLRSLYLRQNVISRNAGVIRSSSSSGDISIVNNTLADNVALFNMAQTSISSLEHNIIYKTGDFNVALLKGNSAARWNCFESETHVIGHELLEQNNLFSDPLFDNQYYLSNQSICLNGGKNGLLIGALGTFPNSRPKLEP